MTNMVTRCPKCATSFRITAAQLQTARGAVRCGSCLHIFRAQDHLVSGGSPAQRPAPGTTRGTTKAPAKPSAAGPAPAAKPAATQAGARPAAAQATHKPPAKQPQAEAPISDRPSRATRKRATDRPEASGANRTPPPKEKPTAAKYSSPSPYSPTATPPPEGDRPANKPAAPKQLSFDQQAIDRELEADDDFLISDAPEDTNQGGDWFLLDENPKNKPPVRESLFEQPTHTADPTEPEETESSDDSWAEQLLDDEPDSPAPAKTPVESPVEPTQPQQAPARENTDEEDQHIHIALRAIRDEEEDPSYGGEGFNALGEDRSRMLIGIDAAPVEMTWKPVRSWRGRGLWLGLSVLAVILLLGQVAWLQFDRLSLIQPYRNVYQAICPLVGCQLPTLTDRSQIRAYNLVVRDHPQVENALVVDAILLNNAPFDQSFPDLVLAFTDIRGDAVASRRFRPEEYLSGELAGRETMPRNQPVHISLELVDPGPNAVNYRAYIPD